MDPKMLNRAKQVATYAFDSGELWYRYVLQPGTAPKGFKSIGEQVVVGDRLFVVAEGPAGWQLDEVEVVNTMVDSGGGPQEMQALRIVATRESGGHLVDQDAVSVYCVLPAHLIPKPNGGVVLQKFATQGEGAALELVKTMAGDGLQRAALSLLVIASDGMISKAWKIEGLYGNGSLPTAVEVGASAGTSSWLLTTWDNGGFALEMGGGAGWTGTIAWTVSGTVAVAHEDYQLGSGGL